MAKPKIGLDNGHGLDTGGKRTPIFTDGTKSPYTGKNFMHEWEFNRATVIHLKKELLRCGFDVVQISPTEYDTSINSRWRKANEENVDFLLSVHANALKPVWNTANGIETCVKRGGSKESYRIGKILNDELVAATGLKDRWAGRGQGLYERDDLGVLNWSRMPAALVECGFMDNPKEAKLLLSDSYRKLCAQALAKGLCKAYKMPYVPENKKEPEGEKGMTKFKDVPKGHWAENAIKAVSEQGIMNGVSDDSFGMGQPITREQMAVIVANLLNKK